MRRGHGEIALTKSTRNYEKDSSQGECMSAGRQPMLAHEDHKDHDDEHCE